VHPRVIVDFPVAVPVGVLVEVVAVVGEDNSSEIKN